VILRGLGGYNLVIDGLGGGQVAAVPIEAPRNLVYAWRNHLLDATLTPSDEVAGCPAENLKKQKRGKSWMTETAEAAPFQKTLHIELPEAQLINFFALVEHNLTGDCTITIQGNSSDDFTGPVAYYEQIPALEAPIGYGEGGYGYGGYGGYPPTIDGKAQAPRCHFLGLDSDGNPPYYKYWLITIEVPSLETIDYTDIGVMFLGEYEESAVNYLYGLGQSIIDPSDIDDAYGDALIENNKEIYSEIDISISRLNTSEFQQRFLAFFYSTGRKRNFILMLDPYTALGRVEQSFYGRFIDRLGRSYDHHDSNTITMKFREVTA
jgi:hypothetical protein